MVIEISSEKWGEQTLGAEYINNEFISFTSIEKVKVIWPFTNSTTFW